MGMFNDHRNTSREGWKFTYTGKELVVSAKVKWSVLRAKEMDAKKKAAVLVGDPKVGPDDKDLAALRRDIQEYGNEREQCQVWIHEFARNPSREYSLGLGDVTYFDLAKDPELELDVSKLEFRLN